ncbi:hypothetical protein [Tissierella pigra]|uniref:Lipoprotein n=1 Tax=Tissierella pigra TaxID=2607614 RepID=A0A6N7XM73_9FIRM|nr:hypothetical protein [Tissierella pigra]MSU03201.1 hypothetical protein [Tissierella pigra]
MKLKKFISIIVISILSISLISCSNSNNKEEVKLREEEKLKEEVNSKEKVKPNKNRDENLTDELVKEEEVYDGQIYFQDDWVIGAISIEDGVPEEKGKEIAQKYAEKLKEKYKDKKVNVQAVQDGKNIANIEL